MICSDPTRLNELLANFPIQGFNSANSRHLAMLHANSIAAIGATAGLLPIVRPFERHPYLLQLIPNDNISGIMIGTLPPISYLCDSLNLPLLNFGNQDITPAKFPYFHGNLGSLWNYCSINYAFISQQARNMRRGLVEQGLTNSGIIYTDVIKYCQRKPGPKYTASDKELSNIAINEDLYDYLFESKSINRIYFTNSSFFMSNADSKLIKPNGNYSLSQRDAFQLFLKGAQNTEHILDFRLPIPGMPWININEGGKSADQIRFINNMLKTKVYIKLRLTKNRQEKIFDVASAVSPAAVNRGMVRRNPCVRRYSTLTGTPIDQSPCLLLMEVLANFFNQTLPALTQYNI